MATSTMSERSGPETPGGPGEGDSRAGAFCSRSFPELFHAVAYANEIWRPDPFDVGSIHPAARETFQRIVGRVRAASRLPAGRILLLLGESGCGKTHLMRAFRNQVHSRGSGYCGYLQMTAFTGEYGRYVLNNLIDSLDKPYNEARSDTTGLMRLSNALAESGAGGPPEGLDRLREGGLDQASLDGLVADLADRIILDDRFQAIDVYLVQALLYLQANDPRIKARILKYLRCEDLTEHDRRLLGGIVPCTYSDAPQRLIERLGQLMWAVEEVPLILCVDQLEDVFDLEEAAVKFRRAMATLCDLVSRLRSAIVVIACLEDFYSELKQLLTRPIKDRVESDPPPVDLATPCDRDQVEQLIAQRLKFLYEALEVPFRADQPTYPIPEAMIDQLVGLRARDVLGQVHIYREKCVAKGKMAASPFDGNGPVDGARGLEQRVSEIEQAWNEIRSTAEIVVPIDEAELAGILSEAIVSCSDELESGERFEAEADRRFVPVERQSGDEVVERNLVGICNRGAQAGALSRQIDEVVKRAGEHTPVIVRSTAFPSTPKAAVVQQLGKLIAGGGRRAVVEDSDWRTMMALAQFSLGRRAGGDPGFAAWLRRTRPLTSLASLRAILGLDRREEPRAGSTGGGPEHGIAPGEKAEDERPVPPAAATRTPEPAAASAHRLVVGRTGDRRGEPVEIEPGELTRHAAFLGAPGSGKTTAALGILEQLLVGGVPAILVDRKGDLCAYAAPDLGVRPGLGGELAGRAERLRGAVEVALYTPRRPDGRPLSIAAVPAGLGALSANEREQAAKFAAAALAGMMNYGDQKGDQPRLAILFRAIDLLSREAPQAAVSIKALVDFIAEKDPALVNAVGYLDVKLFDRLVQDLETLRHIRGDLLAAEGEPLDVDALLGLGTHRRPGRTRLTIISTKFLGTNQDVQFWVAQLLMALGRWISRSPARDGTLQAVVLFDEADLYLPAVRQPATKEPMEHLLRRARSAGLGLLLATQSPGDFDYKGRDNIRAWFLGQVKEANSIAKMKPMLSECRIDVADRLPKQEPGEFCLVRGGEVTPVRVSLSVVEPRQLPEDEIVRLARRGRPRH
jgi:Cdc6-like AAA superfamily ATPase